MAISFKYGDYEFKPAPLFTIDAKPLKTPDGVGYGIDYNINVEGLIVLTGAEVSEGITGVFDRVEALKSALDHDGKVLAVSCGDEPILSGHPLIDSFNISNDKNDQYAITAAYKINFVMPTTIGGTGADNFNDSTHPPYIESCDESWDVEFQDERMPVTFNGEKFQYQAAVTHKVDVKARIAYTGDEYSTTPWEDAVSYATGKLGFDNDFVSLTGILGLSIDTYFNHYRQVATNKSEGSISVTETFLAVPTGTVGASGIPNSASETFDIQVSQDDGLANVTINGEIQGFCDVSYATGFQVVTSKYDNATSYYNSVKPRLYDRANSAYQNITGTCFSSNLNAQVRSRTVGLNPIEGTISYSYSYDTQPSGCITGDCIISQNITIDDTLATDVFASQVILGRAAGPILQDIGTITARVRTLNAEIVTLPAESCADLDTIYANAPRSQVDSLIATISGDLTSNYDQVFVSSNTENWNFTQGRYTRSIGFTYNTCS